MRPSLKKTSDSSIPQKFASGHSLHPSTLEGQALAPPTARDASSALDGSARASSQRSEFMKVLTLVAAVLFLGATMTITTTFARSATPERNPLDASAVGSPSSA